MLTAIISSALWSAIFAHFCIINLSAMIFLVSMCRERKNVSPPFFDALLARSTTGYSGMVRGILESLKFNT